MKKYLILFSFILSLFIGKFSVAVAQTSDSEEDSEETTVQQLYLENLQLKNQLLQYQLKLQHLQQTNPYQSGSPIPGYRPTQFNAIQR